MTKRVIVHLTFEADDDYDPFASKRGDLVHWAQRGVATHFDGADFIGDSCYVIDGAADEARVEPFGGSLDEYLDAVDDDNISPATLQEAYSQGVAAMQEVGEQTNG